MSANSYGVPDSNPFEVYNNGDPSVTNLTNRTNNVQPSLEGYNPFETPQNSSQPVGTGSKSTSVQGPVMASQPQMKGSSPPPYSEIDQNTSLGLQKRQEELERKASELQAREEQLNAAVPVRNNNWPPLPKKCCFGPCFYQDITLEIPSTFQKTVRTMYYMWMFYTFLLFLNMVGALALFIASGDGVTFGVSILVFVLFSPMSFVCWFRPLYKAFRSDSSFNFMVFFFVFFFQFIVAVFYAVGIPHFGSCGLLNGIATISTASSRTVSTYTVGIIAIFIGFLWAIDAFAAFFMLVKIHRIYRSTGASLSRAQQELTAGVIQNEHVQQAATSVVTQAAQQAVNQNLRGTRY